MADIDRTTFAEEARSQGQALDPARANLLFAREIAYSDLRPSEYLLHLDDLRVDAARALRQHVRPAERARALGEFLFEVAGFQGNRADYGDPRNSYLNDVLERRLGLPISLSVLYVYLGQELGLPVHGVGMPGHFIVGVQAEAGSSYLDPFNGGVSLTLDDCTRLVAQSTGHRGAFDQRWLAPTPPRDVVARMLNNLRNVYIEAEDWLRAIRVVERLRELQLEVADHLRDLGMLCYKDGAYNSAARFLGEYLALVPGASDAETVRQSRDLLLDEFSRLN